MVQHIARKKNELNLRLSTAVKIETQRCTKLQYNLIEPNTIVELELLEVSNMLLYHPIIGNNQFW